MSILSTLDWLVSNLENNLIKITTNISPLEIKRNNRKSYNLEAEMLRIRLAV